MKSNSNSAHLRTLQNGTLEEHDLSDHLLNVSRIAALFAVEFGNADWAAAAGMLHDLGKFNPKWQEYIRKSNGDYLEDADGQD